MGGQEPMSTLMAWLVKVKIVTVLLFSSFRNPFVLRRLPFPAERLPNWRPNDLADCCIPESGDRFDRGLLLRCAWVCGRQVACHCLGPRVQNYGFEMSSFQLDKVYGLLGQLRVQ